MSLIKKLVLSLLLVIVCQDFLMGQNLPYSRYGLGNLYDPEFTNLRGWGGLSAAFHNPFTINFANPASYSDIKLATLDAAAFVSLLKLYTADTSVSFGDGSVANLALGFPLIKNKAGVSIGISPYSRVSYSITQENDSSAEFGNSYNLFQGDGGLYRFYVGGGYRYKKLSVGINASYLFGTIDYTDILAFPESLNAFNTRRQEFRRLGDLLFDAGAQYRILFGKDKLYFLDLGFAGNFQTNIHARRDLIYDRFTYIDDAGNPINTVNPFDTIYSSLNEKGEVTLPGAFSTGAIFSKQYRYSIGANFKYTLWSNYKSFGEGDQTSDTWKLSFGGEVIPDYKSYQQYWKVISYRAGLSYGQNYVELNQNKLRQFTVSMGAGLPLRRSFSQVSFSAEWVHIGFVEDNPLAASFFRFTAGFTLNDKWFQKRKFD
ncbi:MAG: hypothetical protein ABI729_04105 [Chitinophagales bacterium]